MRDKREIAQLTAQLADALTDAPRPETLTWVRFARSLQNVVSRNVGALGADVRDFGWDEHRGHFAFTVDHHIGLADCYLSARRHFAVLVHEASPVETSVQKVLDEVRAWLDEMGKLQRAIRAAGFKGDV
jgi:hypothetical protein